MARQEDSGLYTGSLLTLNANSSDEYVKGIYDEWAEKYDKVLPLSVIFPISEIIRAMGTSFWRSDFWDRLCGLALILTYDWLMVALNTIDQS